MCGVDAPPVVTDSAPFSVTFSVRPTRIRHVPSSHLVLGRSLTYGRLLLAPALPQALTFVADCRPTEHFVSYPAGKVDERLRMG
jgi:hypothetical protein